MSKKSKSSVSMLGLLAFVAIIIKAIAYILSYVGGGLGILTFAADVTLTIISLIVAWSFAKNCSKVWKVIYFIILILVIIGFVFGVLRL